MPLATRAVIVPLLRCPRCRSPLAGAELELRCTSLACALAARSFPEAGGQPAVIDFERSVVSADALRAGAGTSLVARGTGGGWGAAFRRLAAPRNRTAGRCAAALLARLTAGAGRTRPRVLVVGGGTRGAGTAALYEDPRLELVAFDVYASPETQFIADAHQIPLDDATVDAVWVQAVLEHVIDPRQVVAEIERVLVPGGLVYAETPFLQHVHEGPWDFTRFTESGHRWLFRGFERLDSGAVAGPAEVWLWATEMLTRGLTRSTAAGKFARLAWSWVRLLDGAIPGPYAIDGASCVYFFGRKSATPLDPAGAIRHYAGAQRPASPS